MLDKQMEDQRTRVCAKLRWTMRRHHQRCGALMEQIGIGRGQMPVLLELHCHGPMTQRELAERTHVTPATISGTLKRMERAGIVCRSSSSEDARISIVSLSKLGMARMDEAHGKFMQTDFEMLRGISSEECAQMEVLLDRMLENMGAAPPAEE